MATIRTNVMVGDHNGKKQLLGMASFSTCVEWLSNRAFHIPDEAQRSLAKGSDVRSTMELLEDDKLHTTPRMKEVVEFYRHLILLNEQGMNGEGFLGTVQLVVPLEFEGARVQYLPTPTDADPDTRVGVFTAKTGHKQPAFYIGDGQGRLVGLYSLERSVKDDIDKLDREVRKLSKLGSDTTARMQDLAKAKAFRDKVHRFLSANQLAFICYAGDIAADGTVTGLDTDAQRRLYIEGNALNDAASKEELIKYESFSPVIRRLIVLRDRIEFMRPEYIEDESKSIGLNSPRVFTLSTLTRAYSLSIINLENPIKPSTDKVFESVPVRAEFVQAFWEKVQELFGPRWTQPQLPQPERTKYLQEHRRRKTIYFSAIFLDALGRVGYQAGLHCGWQKDADLSFLDTLSGLDYDPATAPDWKGLMMKQSAKEDENGETGWVFNNTKDSAEKVYKHLIKQLDIEVGPTN